MPLDKARTGLGRAERELARLSELSAGTDRQGFEDLLPYVLDLLDGVSRQVNEHRPRTLAFSAWWPSQMTEDRQAIREMRHAHLKRLESHTDQKAFSQTNVSAGTFMGRTLNSGDSIVWWSWAFTTGRFAGHDVMVVLRNQLEYLGHLIDEAEAKLA